MNCEKISKQLEVIKVRNAKLEDAVSLYNIEVENFGIDEATELDTFQYIIQEKMNGCINMNADKTSEHINKDQRNYFLRSITIDSIVVGFYCAIIKDLKIELVDIAVSKKWQNKKIGTILFHDFITKIPSQISEAYLKVRRGNLSAIKLYSNFGFIENKIFSNHYDDGEDALEMKRATTL